MATYLFNRALLAVGMGTESETVFNGVRWLYTSYPVLVVVAVASVVTFVAVKKSRRLYQKSLAKLLSRVKEYKNLYEATNSLDINYANKYQKSYNKLTKKIKNILAWNNRNIYIKPSMLEDKTNLSLDKNNPVTFNDLLNKIILERGSKVKINGEKAVQAVVVKEEQQVIMGLPAPKINTLVEEEENSNTNAQQNKTNLTTEELAQILESGYQNAIITPSAENETRIYKPADEELTR